MYSQINEDTVMGIPTGTTTEINAVTPYEEGALAYDTVTKRLMYYNGTSWVDSAGTNWLTNGNTGNSSTSFLGNIDNVKMQIRSNNWPMLEFGKRGTLGLTQNYPDYKDSAQPLVHVGGDGSTSALQFAASGADFYKPMFYTTSNGSFRLKGASGGTDIFEIGSAGTTNNGRLEFIIGDDGIEPIIFKRYDYNDYTYKEFFRVQGSVNSTNAKTRFGINLNPTGVPIDGTYNTADTGDVANSTFQVKGSVSKSIYTTTGNLTLTEDYYTIVLAGNHTISLPTASTCTGRIYVIKNKNTVATTISSYTNNLGTAVTTIQSNSSLTIQSDGSIWQQITNDNISKADTVTSITNTNTATTKKEIATYSNEASTVASISETVTSLSQDDTNATGEITFKNENGTETKAQVVGAETDNQIKVGANGGAYLGQTVYVGVFQITGTGNKVITGLPFKPSQITFVANANVEDFNLDSDNGIKDNDTTIANSFGTMNGFARNNNGTNVQQVIYVGGSGNSINDISRFASNSNCIGLRYSNQNGLSLGNTIGEIGTFDTSGFTINVTSFAENVLVMYTAYK